MKDPQRMPAAFLRHGNPMNALDDNRYTRAWRAFGEQVPRPRAILVVPAHWCTNATAVTAMPIPRTIHDFYGFPPELFAVQYPAQGEPSIAEEISDALHPTRVGLDADSWGIDHGTWSVLVHAFPAADVPVLQLSINATRPLDFHLDLGAKLGPLRDRGILVIGSGNAVHNLRRIDWSSPDAAYDWARPFDEGARELMLESPSDVLKLGGRDDFALAHPTPDHFIPLLYVAGLAAEEGSHAEVLIDGFTMGSISMIAYTVGCGPVQVSGTGGGAPGMPGVSPEDANI